MGIYFCKKNNGFFICVISLKIFQNDLIFEEGRGSNGEVSTGNDPKRYKMSV